MEEATPSPSMTNFNEVYIAPRVRVALKSVFESRYVGKFWEIVDRLRCGHLDIPGLRVEKLHTKGGKVYSARLNVDMRIIFSMYSSDAGSKRSLVIWDANHHDAAYERIERAAIPALFEAAEEYLEPVDNWLDDARTGLSQLAGETLDSDEIVNGLLLFKVPHFVLSEPDKYKHFERNLDRYLRLSEEQEELVNKQDRCLLVQGGAGTGKTSLALFYALNLYERSPEDDIFFFTYQEELASVCRCYKVNLLGQEEGEENACRLRVFSYLEFCRHYLKKFLDAREIHWQWIERQKSISYLSDIIQSRARWSRNIRPDDTYSYIYSILKGRFVPGSDRLPGTPDDFKRIFKGYGTVPENLEDILEIFGHYEDRLARKRQKDEADLIRYCYQSLKERAVLSSSGNSTWIVIDEIQDFTELEWKSILLFWENKCRLGESHPSFPFLSGDRNQNISRSGFRWQEVDSYIESTLKQLHRPNSLQKVQLHQNFRNTAQVFALGSFIRLLGPEPGRDLGTPPSLTGRSVEVVVGSEGDFLEFLTLIASREENASQSPLVVLFEDEAQLQSMRSGLSEDNGIFLMPLSASKGMEFEDLIIYRLFSSLSKPNLSEDMRARLFDLWYMGVMRARQSLLVFLLPSDLEVMKGLLGDRFQEFAGLTEIHDLDSVSHLLRFFQQRESYLPNYNVVFLERIKAQQCWDEMKKLKDAAPDEVFSARADELRAKALNLWGRCRDFSKLGKAYLELERFAEAVPYLKQAGLLKELGHCHEMLGEFAEAATAFAEDHEFLDAARCYESAHDYQAAALIFEQQEEWMQAGVNFRLAGDNTSAAQCFEKSSMWQEAADLYRSRSGFLKAAEMYVRCEQFEQAAEMYLKVKDKLDAARCLSRAGLYEKAARLHEYLNRFAEAAECYEQAQLFQKAGELYNKSGRLKDAARCKEQAGNLAGAAATWERLKNWDKAAQVYASLGQMEKAGQCYENSQSWQKALDVFTNIKDWYRCARCLEKLSDFKQAATYYLQCSAFAEAAYCYERLEEWAQAADAHLKANNLGGAATVLSRLGRRLDASRLYLLSGQHKIALDTAAGKQAPRSAENSDLRPELAAWADETKRFDLAGVVYESLGDIERACDRYKQAMMLMRVAQCLENAGRIDQAADFYMQEGNFEKAARCFGASKQWRKAAGCFELLKKWDEARRIYEQMDDQDGIARCQSAANWL